MSTSPAIPTGAATRIRALQRVAGTVLGAGALARRGLSIGQLIGAITGGNASIPGGDVDLGARRFTLQTTGAYRDTRELADTIVGGAPVNGPADRLMAPLGIEVSPVGVARHYAPWCATLVIDAVDAHHAAAVEAEGVRAVVADT